MFVKDVETVLDYLHIQKTAIIAFSDGGNTALLFAQIFPEKVTKLVVVGANITPEGMKKTELLKIAGTLAAFKVTAGEHDVITLSHTEWITEHIKNGRLVIIPKADHFFLTKKPSDFNSIVES